MVTIADYHTSPGFELDGFSVGDVVSVPIHATTGKREDTYGIIMGVFNGASFRPFHIRSLKDPDEWIGWYDARQMALKLKRGDMYGLLDL
jgi:hypothetical protein